MVLVAAAVLAAGCTAEEAPEPGPIESSTPDAVVTTPEPSAEPTEEPVVAPVRPPEMDRLDEVGAVAAARYFIELEEYVFRTGDLAQWSQISLQDCGFCQGVREQAERVYGGGGRHTGSVVTTGDARLVGHDEALNGYAVEVEYSAGPGYELDATGAVVAELPVERGYMVLDVLPVEGAWALLSVSGSERSVS